MPGTDRFILAAVWRSFVTVGVLLPVLATAAAGQAPEPLQVLERAAARYRQADALCADFRQELSVPLLDQRREGTGRLCQRQPNLFSMRFDEPAGDLVVVDGEHVWIYYPSRDAKQVLRGPLALSSDGTGLDFHREFLESPAETYEVRHDGMEMVDGTSAHRIVLRPRQDARYREAVVWIGGDDALLHRVEIREENGSIRTVHLRNITLDPDIPAGTFSFTPPPGTQVITP